MEKLVQAYFFQGRIILSPMARTEKGMSLAFGLCIEMDPFGPETTNGQIILRALNEFRIGVPHPNLRDLQESETPILKFLGLKKYSILMRSAKLVIISKINGIIKFTPNRNEGRGGYVNLLELAFTLDEVLGEELFPSLKEAFERCS